MRKWRLILAAAALAIPAAAMGQTSTPNEGAAVESHPEISADASWAGDVAAGILIMFAAAALCGPWAPAPPFGVAEEGHEEVEDTPPYESYLTGTHQH